MSNANDTLDAIVHTAEGEVKTFTGGVAKFIVSHPRWSALIASEG
jgi:hypothetical protein